MKKSFIFILLLALASVCFARPQKQSPSSEIYQAFNSEFRQLGFDVISLYTCDTLEDMESIAGDAEDWVLIADEDFDEDLTLAIVAVCRYEGEKVAVIMIYEDYEMLIMMSDLN